jgi:predicted GNAT family N-acyltransferase
MARRSLTKGPFSTGWIMKIAVQDADFGADIAALRFIRLAVFVEEQGVPVGLEFDEHDPHCRHFLAMADGAAVGTARIDLAQGAKLGRLAVLREFRGFGAGRALTLACHQIARESGFDQVWCNAQVSAQGFYARLGYRVVGDPFVEAGIDHLRMQADLRLV